MRVSHALAALTVEHGVLRATCDALDRFASGGMRLPGGSGGARADRAELGSFVRVLHDYGDAFHHAKEEDVLFAAMVAEGGMSTESGPLAVMLGDHERGRAHVVAMAAAAEGAGPWDEVSRGRAVAEARQFTKLLRAHMAREDAVLYPMALRCVPALAMARVDAQCSDIVAPAELAALAQELSGRWGPLPGHGPKDAR